MENFITASSFVAGWIFMLFPMSLAPWWVQKLSGKPPSQSFHFGEDKENIRKQDANKVQIMDQSDS